MLTAEIDLAYRPGRSRRELADAIARAEVECRRLVGLAEDLLLASADASDAIFDVGALTLRP